MRQRDEWLYPHWVTPHLQQARGPLWGELIEYLATLDESHEDSLAFALLMIRLCGCTGCQPGSYKLSLGCATCAFRTVANTKGSDNALLRRYQSAREEIQHFLAEQQRQSA